jgi:single-strand DNA-binding protein
MNNVTLIGRLTRDPEVRYTSGSQMAVARFSVAIDRPVKSGQDKQTDFPSIVVFGKQAENCERFLTKGRLVGIEGRIQTGSYTNKDGNKVYTTDVIVDAHEFVEKKSSSSGSASTATEPAPEVSADGFMSIPDGIDEELPFT